MLNVEEVTLVRRMVLNLNKGIRETARKVGVSRNTVRKYLTQSEPRRREGPRRRPVLERVAPRIEELLDEWKDRTTPKQRVTGSRVLRQLREEGFEVGVTTVRDYLRERRRRKAEVFVPLIHRAGDEAQVDFFAVTVDVDGQRRKAWKFLMRSMFSGRDCAWLYDRCDQVSFLDGHVRAFARLGAVPRRLIYDNLKSAVKRRVGLKRELSERFQALASHYCFEPCFARPGEGHDKGGVESRGKAIRLQHMTPVPIGRSLSEISQALQADIDRLAADKRDAQGGGVIERFEEERPLMLPLPPAPFEARRLASVSVNRKAQVSVEAIKYSTPSRWAGLDATADVGVEQIRLVCRGEEVVHRKAAKGAGPQTLYRHYLRDLSRKPQAVRQVAPELVKELGWPFELLWQRLERRLEPLAAARALAGVLGMILEHGEDKIARLLERMLADGRLDLLSLGSALRKDESPQQTSVPETLRGYRIESARAADFDHLLEGGAR